MEKINIAELLKDCPKGMELDCTMWDNVCFVGVAGSAYPIKIETPEGLVPLDKYGCYSTDKYAKCVIFPKGKTTWEGFVPPCKFKDGDIVITTLGNIAIIRKHVGKESFCIYGLIVNNNFYKNEVTKVCVKRLATKEEKQKLFDAIKENGYKWNAETKTLEKLQKFKVGDIVQYITDSTDRRKIEEIDTLCNMYHTDSLPIIFEVEDEWKSVLNSENVEQNLSDEVEPKFHKGDWIVFNGLTLYVKEVVKGFYRTISKGGISNSYDWDIDKIARLWTIQDAKDGDVLVTEDKNFTTPFVAIYKNIGDTVYDNITFNSHCFIGFDGNFYGGEEGHTIEDIHPATKEQSDLLFQKMKEAGYTWSKTLKKVIEPKFKVGDTIQYVDGYRVEIFKVNIDEECYEYISVIANGIGSINFSEQDNWKLAPNKFDIDTLVPFESRVLCRDGNAEKWKPNFFGFYDNAHAMNYPFECCGTSYSQCIPFEGNEHLLGKTDDCDEYYKSWE